MEKEYYSIFLQEQAGTVILSGRGTFSAILPAWVANHSKRFDSPQLIIASHIITVHISSFCSTK